MPEVMRVVLAYLGYDRLTLELDEESREQVMRASIVPFLVLLALALQLYVEYRYDSIFGIRPAQTPEFWQHVYGTALTVSGFGPPLALAVLFLSGLQAWSRAGGSWMLVIGLALVVLSLGFGVSAAALHAVEGPEQAFVLRSQTWTNWATDFGFLAAGYVFVAYRAAQPRRARQRLRARQVRIADRTSEPEGG